MESDLKVEKSKTAEALYEFKTTPTVATAEENRTHKLFNEIREARLKGYEGDMCGECGQFTMVRNGTCLKCETCGATSGCS